MFAVSDIHRPNLHLRPSISFVTSLVILLTFCGLGKGFIVVFEGGTKLEEFANVELPFTQIVRKNGIEGLLVAANPLHACLNITKPPDIETPFDWFVLISGASCNFELKVLNAKLAGYSAAIIYTYRGRVESSGSHRGHYQFYSDIPAVTITTEDGLRLRENYLFTVSERIRIGIFPNNSFNIVTFLLLFSIVAGLFLVIMLAFTIIRFFQQSNMVQNGCLSSQHLRQLQTSSFKKGDVYETCAICLEDYKDHDKLRILPCSHGYHTKCIDPWLTNNRRICPVCKRKVLLAGESSNIEHTETTPLLQAQRSDPVGTLSYVNEDIWTATNLPAASGQRVTQSAPDPSFQ